MKTENPALRSGARTSTLMKRQLWTIPILEDDVDVKFTDEEIDEMLEGLRQLAERHEAQFSSNLNVTIVADNGKQAKSRVPIRGCILGLKAVPDNVPFVIISDSDNEITTLPIRPAPPSSDRIPALSGYPLDPDDDSSDEDLSETAESLHTQTASTSVVTPTN
ncbi:hypothetical protein Tco_0212600 [Tanacetum coccineum]